MSGHDDGGGVAASDTEPHVLGGAYVLNAVSERERELFEAHVRRCASCAAEVVEFAETTARLGMAVAEAPPPGMRAAVLRRIATVRQDRPPVAERDEAPAGRRRRRLLGLALAACVAVAAAGAGGTLWQWRATQDAERRAESAERRADELAAVLSAGDARLASGPLPGGGSASVVVSAEADRAAFLATGLPELPDDRVYQLWFDEEGGMRPAGLLGSGAGEWRMLEGAVDGASGMGVTVEPAGGSPEPTGEPLAVMAFPTG
ncbi:anti-sigma factor [Streptomyces hainanensis]|uniref:Regulator of SigK n=1 Tax=Streptomyces hainanensis TaxID=402648 RepID=A0A4R4SLQ4_9ACTN|nr:anti-sigma factor [Streptomyces hainanensis]TDC63444.1 anti-sigma factor [Streptomyces hainanensis]